MKNKTYVGYDSSVHDVNNIEKSEIYFDEDRIYSNNFDWSIDVPSNFPELDEDEQREIIKKETGTACWYNKQGG
jgi:hypothetical protein